MGFSRPVPKLGVFLWHSMQRILQFLRDGSPSGSIWWASQPCAESSFPCASKERILPCGTIECRHRTKSMHSHLPPERSQAACTTSLGNRVAAMMTSLSLDLWGLDLWGQTCRPVGSDLWGPDLWGPDLWGPDLWGQTCGVRPI